MSLQLSKRTKSLVALLYTPASTLSLEPDKTSTVKLIGEALEPAAIPNLAPFLFDQNSVLAQAAGHAIAGLFELLRPADFPWLDEMMRQRSPHWYHSYPSPWWELRPDQLERLHRFGKTSVYAFGIASFHFSGYVREEALRQLRNVKSGTELTFLLMRLNDWVAEVRNEANRLIRERLTRHYALFFVRNLALVQRLHATSRAALDILGAIETLLEKDQQALQMGLESDDLAVRRSCYMLAFASSAFNQALIVRRALSESDPAIRLLGTSKLSFLQDQTSTADLLSRARRDRFAAARRRAFKISLERYPASARSLLEQALTDPNRSIRSYAQFMSVKESSFNLRSYYLSALSRADLNLYAVICGLGETGASEDGRLLTPYVSHHIARIRGAVVRALARLNAQEFVPIFETCLSDPSPSVSREAKNALGKLLYLIPADTIWNLFAITRDVHVRKNALFLISRLGKWDSIGYLLEALCTDDKDLRKLADSYIGRWYEQFNRSFRTPTPAQVERASSALMRCGDRLQNPLKKQIMLAIEAS